jgi:hypothetical protein
VYDVVDDAEAARVEVAPTRESWFWITIDGDRVYLSDGAEGTHYVVDWRAGEVVDSGDDVPDTVAGGHALVDGPSAIDVASGETVADFPDGAWVTLSPDGRFAKYAVADEKTFETGPTHVVDLATGDSVEVGKGDWGWTPSGDVFEVGDDEVTTCSSTTGDCTTTAVDIPRLAHVKEPSSSTEMLMPRCDGFGDDLDAETECWNSTDCSEPDADCEKVPVETDESWDEEIVLGGVIRES